VHSGLRLLLRGHELLHQSKDLVELLLLPLGASLHHLRRPLLELLRAAGPPLLLDGFARRLARGVSGALPRGAVRGGSRGGGRRGGGSGGRGGAAALTGRPARQVRGARGGRGGGRRRRRGRLGAPPEVHCCSLLATLATLAILVQPHARSPPLGVLNAPPAPPARLYLRPPDVAVKRHEEPRWWCREKHASRTRVRRQK
jgi:hypothetical protein